ncbi:hypothetical protein B0J17DRAFT_713108 [Rhizoctonia solani]|nr:hypothetical protein B0J17DRAFT_713108 [Rhizoctonia solani]
MAPTRSTTGCLACKTKRKKCDETKPYCLRCQKSRIECPGYIYIQNSNKPHKKLRTLLAPRTVTGQYQAAAHQATPSANAEELEAQLQEQLPLGHELVPSDAAYNVTGSSVALNVGAPSETIDISNNLTSSSSSTGTLQHSSINFNPSHQPEVNIAKPETIPSFPSTSTAAPMTSGQASLLEALFSLGQPPHLDSPQHCAQAITRPTIELLSDMDTSFVSNWPPHDTGRQYDGTSSEGESSWGVADVICTQPVLDRTVKSNALPFVLQSYVTWISRMALEPLRLTRLARDFVFRHFEGGEQSRWIVVLLANTCSRVGSVYLVETTPSHLLSMLQQAVRRRLAAVKSLPGPKEAELVQALDCAIETLLIHIYASHLSEAMTLRHEAAPIFRQLCSEPPGAPINLNLLLQHPLHCLRHYAEIDITFSVVTDMPTLFRYDVAIADSQHSELYRANQGDGIIQWRIGLPNQLILSFAKMKSMHQDQFTPNGQTVALLERDLRELLPFSGPSSDRFLAVMRSVVQECWRQAAFIYLYMAVCGDPCDTSRVKRAFKRYSRLLRATKPGRLPDEFLILTLLLVSPAAEQKSDRETIRQRILGLYRRSKAVRDSCIGMLVIEDFWARADAEGRPTTWSDVAVSRKRMAGI